MTAPAASLLDVEPSLGRIAGAAVAERIGRRPVLPVLSVPAGPWSPPAPRELGESTFALALLDGLLLGHGPARVVSGPGDWVEPWTRGWHWTVCADLRVAVLGREVLDALAACPRAAGELRAGPRANHPRPAANGPLETQVLLLLWHLGRRWGRLEATGISLPATVAPRALALLTSASEERVEDALARLSVRGVVRIRAAGGWLLPGPGTGTAGGGGGGGGGGG